MNKKDEEYFHTIVTSESPFVLSSPGSRIYKAASASTIFTTMIRPILIPVNIRKIHLLVRTIYLKAEAAAVSITSRAIETMKGKS